MVQHLRRAQLLNCVFFIAFDLDQHLFRRLAPLLLEHNSLQLLLASCMAPWWTFFPLWTFLDLYLVAQIVIVHLLVLILSRLSVLKHFCITHIDFIILQILSRALISVEFDIRIAPWSYFNKVSGRRGGDAWQTKVLLTIAYEL